MDIENLIEQLNRYFEGETLPRGTALDAATALSTLKAENERLREKIEDARLEGYAKGLGEMSEENEKLRAELEQVRRERDAAVKCIEEIEDALNFQRISAIGLRISEWRGQED